MIRTWCPRRRPGRGSRSGQPLTRAPSAGRKGGPGHLHTGPGEDGGKDRGGKRPRVTARSEEGGRGRPGRPREGLGVWQPGDSPRSVRRTSPFRSLGEWHVQKPSDSVPGPARPSPPIPLPSKLPSTSWHLQVFSASSVPTAHAVGQPLAPGIPKLHHNWIRCPSCGPSAACRVVPRCTLASRRQRSPCRPGHSHTMPSGRRPPLASATECPVRGSS